MPTIISSVVDGLKPFASRLTWTEAPGSFGSTLNQLKGPGTNVWSTSSFSTRSFSIGIGPEVLEGRNPRKRVEDEDRAAVQRVDEPGIGGAQQSAALGESVGGADPRLEQAPGDGIARIAGVVHGGKQLREDGVRPHIGRDVLALLVVETQARIHRELSGSNRISEEGVIEVETRLGVLRPRHVGDLGAVMEFEAVPEELISGPPLGVSESYVPIAEPEFQLVPQVAV